MVTGVMFLAACGLGIVLIVAFAGGIVKLSDVDATVPATGGASPVQLTPHTSFLLWDQAAYSDQCTIAEQRTGATIEVQDLRATNYHRTDRSGTWYGAGYVDSGSGDLEVTCPPVGGPVQFGARPLTADVLGNTALTVTAMLVLGTLGLSGLIVTLVLLVTGRPRGEVAGRR